jgi:hypothetical protein
MSLVVSGSQEKYMVGDNVRVRLINVSIDRGHVDFELVKQRDSGRPEHKERPARRRQR